MAFLANHTESDLMRAVTHARLHVTSGRGLESVVHELAVSNLGAVSNALGSVMDEMNTGKDVSEALANVAERVDDDNLRTFLNALRAPGGSAVDRLTDLSETIQQNWTFAVERYGSRVAGLVQFSAILFVVGFFPTILRVFVDNAAALGFDLSLPQSFDAVVFTSLGVFLTVLVLLMRSR